MLFRVFIQVYKMEIIAYSTDYRKGGKIHHINKWLRKKKKSTVLFRELRMAVFNE